MDFLYLGLSLEHSPCDTQIQSLIISCWFVELFSDQQTCYVLLICHSLSVTIGVTNFYL